MRLKRETKNLYVIRGMVGIMVFFAMPALAFTDGPITAAIAMEQKIYDEFMRLQVIQQVKTLRDNYVASERYYAMMREVASGKGVAQRLNTAVASVEGRLVNQVQDQFKNDWVKDPDYETLVDHDVNLAINSINDGIGRAEDKTTEVMGKQVNKLIKQMQKYGNTKVEMAAKITDSSIEAQKKGKELAEMASRGNEKLPVSNADLLKALGISIQVQAQSNQLLAQLLDVNSHVAQVQMNQQAALLKQSAILNNIAIDSGKKD